MNPSPSLHSQVRPGPALTLAQTKAPSLVLNAVHPSPALRVSHAGLAPKGDLSHTIPVLVFVCLGSLVSIVTLPLSQGSHWARIPVEQLVGDMSALTPPWSAPEEELATEATVDPIEEEIAAQQQTQTLAPFELLSGVSCPAYFPGEQASAASLAFDEHIWSKLSEQLQSQATERLEVCGPFALVQKDLIVSQGCVENECRTNEVQFFLTADNKAAVEIYVDGECTPSSEPGFRYKNLLCAPR